MATNQSLEGPALNMLRDAFNNAIEACSIIWGEVAFKRPTNDGWRDQLLTGMYDAQMVAVDQLTPIEKEFAFSNSARILEKTRKLFNDSAFDSAVRQGTNTPTRIEYRIEQVLNIISP